MIAIIDYNMGNVGSVANMIKHVGGSSILTNKIEDIKKAEKIILPGVGSFDTGMQNLEELDLIGILKKRVLSDKIPVLGICLGMQLLSESSEEGVAQGLGWIEAETILFSFKKDKSLTIPHMGWNDVTINPENIGLFENMYDEPRFYFDHSYHFVCKNDEEIMAKSEYGYEFTCAVHKENIYGMQFHPEKSHKYGMRIFENFVKL